ncbi:MAG: hypothetical protein AB8U25_00240 [Rickettsiales endosymbiont of Dermacentor nuttalli]
MKNPIKKILASKEIRTQDVQNSPIDDVFNLFRQGKYHDAYEKLCKLKESKEKNLDKGNVYFLLGFILELNLTKDRDIPQTDLPNVIKNYYIKAIAEGCIEAKVRKCFFEEKENRNNIEYIQAQYQSFISEYESVKNKNSVDNLSVLAENAAFAYFRLGRMYEKGKLSSDNHMQIVLSNYENAQKLYEKYDINDIDKARVLNRIAWLKSIEFENNSQKYVSQEEFNESTKDIHNYFQKARDLGLHKAELGILNLNVLLHRRVNQKVSFENLKIEIDKALVTFPRHIKTLINKASIEAIAPSDDGTIAFNTIRKVLTIESHNIEAKKILSQIAKKQASDIGRALGKDIFAKIEYILKTSKGTTSNIKEQQELLMQNFYPVNYVNAKWLKKIFFSSKEINRYLEEQVVWLTSIVAEILSTSDIFKYEYIPIHKQAIIKKLTDELLNDTEILKLIGKVIKDTNTDASLNTLKRRRYAELAALIKKPLKEVCNEKIHDELMMTKGEYELIDVQSRFKALVCEKFRLGRNAIESVANGKASPLPDTIDNIKYVLDRSLTVMNIPPLCYVGNLLGGSALTYALTTFTTDAAYKFYKDIVINTNKEVDEMLPRGRDLLDLIEEVSDHLARQYGPQLVNIKDDKSLEFLADVAVERMMNHAFYKTSTINKIINKVNPRHILDWFQNRDPIHIDHKKLLYEGIIRGKSNNKRRFLHTKVTKEEYGKDWAADGILSKSGIILEDNSMFGTVKGITKYGCAIGTEDDVKNRGFSSISSEKLPSELINIIKNNRDKQIKAQNKLEKANESNDTHKKPDVQVICKPHIRSSKLLVAGLVVAGVSLLFMLFPEIPIIASLVPGAMTLVSSVVPGTCLSGIGMFLGGLIYKLSDKTHSHNIINKEKTENIEYQTLDIQAPLIKERIKGPTSSYIGKIINNNVQGMTIGF